MNDQRATDPTRGGESRDSRPPSSAPDPLRAALRSLPAERAGAGFTARVLARLDEGEGAEGAGDGVLDRSGSAGRAAVFGPAGWAALAAAALAVALGLALARGWAPPSVETIAGSETVPPEVPGAPAPGAAASTGSERAVGSPAAPSEPLAPVVTARVPGAAIPDSAPDASDRNRRAGAMAESHAAAERVSDSARSPGTVRGAAAEPPNAGPRPAAAGPGSASGRPGTAERAAAIPAADARSALERVRAELDALRREHHAFEVALADLPEIGRDGQPVVFLGGDEGLGLVLDLGRESAADDDPETEAGPRSPSL